MRDRLGLYLGRNRLKSISPDPGDAPERPPTGAPVRKLEFLLGGELPFSAGDVTAGSETELQAAVEGERGDVDLAIAIERSSYFANIVQRAAAGEAPRRVVTDLERFLADNPDGVWENSWVRFPRSRLGRFAAEVLEGDLLADKSDPRSGRRRDRERFFVEGELLRLPLSYVLKLALADAIGDLPAPARDAGRRLLAHFSNDNTSPETSSFHVVPLRPAAGMGRALARETAKRYLLTQLLTQYANEAFGLRESGQRAAIYQAPNPPARQRALGTLVSDSFYRELFLSPCLSGWDRGEEKHEYMALCHQTLSRSQLNAIAKLREAGIVTNDLVALPSLCNVSLANNGTHVSLGSRKLGRLLAGESLGFTRADEKWLGDLAIKVVEHFLPLFVGTYSAAPYRLAFEDFHPERALAFLPHELHYTHLRMLWRRWKKKASLSFLGRAITPTGVRWLDGAASRFLGLRGDFVPDFRLLDYPVALLSTDRSPALDGTVGSLDRLKGDLASLGVFDAKMNPYLLYRLREFRAMGFSGFEGRHYSLFPAFEDDLGAATDLQALVTALAFDLIARGEVDHDAIPDGPRVESERRQIFFGAAIGLPTFFVRADTTNRFLARILGLAERARTSRRYPGYVRVEHADYRRALVRLLRERAAAQVEGLGLRDALPDLEARLEDPAGRSAAGRLTAGILDEVGARSPLRAKADEFNRAAERFYRDGLRRRHTAEALAILGRDLEVHDRDGARFLDGARDDVLGERAGAPALRRAIALAIGQADRDAQEAARC